MAARNRQLPSVLFLRARVRRMPGFWPVSALLGHVTSGKSQLAVGSLLPAEGTQLWVF